MICLFLQALREELDRGRESAERDKEVSRQLVPLCCQSIPLSEYFYRVKLACRLASMMISACVIHWAAVSYMTENCCKVRKELEAIES